MPPIPFQTIDWSQIPSEEHPGAPGVAFWKTLQLPGLRIRMVEYSPGYLADHWCEKGHIVHCLEGEFESELKDAETITLIKDTSYIVSDNQSTHRSYSKHGARLLIIDGDFLQHP